MGHCHSELGFGTSERGAAPASVAPRLAPQYLVTLRSPIDLAGVQIWGRPFVIRVNAWTVTEAFRYLRLSWPGHRLVKIARA